MWAADETTAILPTRLSRQQAKARNQEAALKKTQKTEKKQIKKSLKEKNKHERE